MTVVLAILEQRDGHMRTVSQEVLTAARRLADGVDAEVEAVVLASGEVAGVDRCRVHGADRVTVLTNAAFKRYSPEGFAEALAVRAKEAKVVVFAATATGKDLAPRVAAKLDRPLATDVTELDVDDGAVMATRPVYAGKALLRVKLTGTPVLVSVRPNVFTPEEKSREGAVATETVELTTKPRVVVKEVKEPETARLDVAEAPIIVSGGRGLQDPSNFKLIEELAGAIGGDAAVGASRAVVDAGWRPHSDQVGQTGKTVSPQLYVAVGISGAVQHLAGMRTAKVIVAINKDKDAPIFKVADYGIVGDLFEIVPRLTEEIRRVRTA